MKPENLKDIQSSFTVQAKNFENRNMNFSKQEYLDFAVRSMELRSTGHVGRQGATSLRKAYK